MALPREFWAERKSHHHALARTHRAKESANSAHVLQCHLSTFPGGPRGRGLPVDGLVVSRWPDDPGATEETNLERLSAMAPVLGLLPAYPGLDTADPTTAPPELAFLTAP